MQICQKKIAVKFVGCFFWCFKIGDLRGSCSFLGDSFEDRLQERNSKNDGFDKETAIVLCDVCTGRDMSFSQTLKR